MGGGKKEHEQDFTDTWWFIPLCVLFGGILSVFVF